MTVKLSKAYQEYLGVDKMECGTIQNLEVELTVTDANKKWEVLKSLRKKIIHDSYGDGRVSTEEGIRIMEWATNLAMKLLGWA